MMRTKHAQLSSMRILSKEIVTWKKTLTQIIFVPSLDFHLLILLKTNFTSAFKSFLDKSTRAIQVFRKIQTFSLKNRPNKDLFCSKGLYYRPRSLNKDPTGSTALGISTTDSSCHHDICPGYICPYQQYLSCYWLDFGQTSKAGSWDNL